MDGRTLWIAHGDVEGDIEAGNVVKATRPLGDWCLRGDDGSAPVEAGTLLEIVELRPWGAAMAQELPEMHDELNVGDDDQRDAIMQAARELSDMGLWEFVTEAGDECTPSGDVVTVERAVKAVR